MVSFRLLHKHEIPGGIVIDWERSDEMDGWLNGMFKREPSKRVVQTFYPVDNGFHLRSFLYYYPSIKPIEGPEYTVLLNEITMEKIRGIL